MENDEQMKSVKLQKRVVPLALLAVILFFALWQPAQCQHPAKQVVLHFPPDRSLGKLYRLKIASPENPTAEDSPCAEARGNVTLPANTKLMLKVSYEGAADLAPLAKCTDQDVIYTIHACHVESLSDKSLQDIAKLKSVKQLLLTDTDITDKGAEYIGTMPQLLDLDVHETLITAKGLNSLRSLTALKKLELDLLRIKGTDLACLVPMVHLQYLEVGRTGLADNAMKNVGKLTSLVQLKVAKNADITDEGVFYLANLNNLQELSLRETGVTKKCLPVLQKLSRLTSVELSLPPQDVAQIAQSLHKTNPGCQIQGKTPKKEEEFFR